MAGLLLVWSQRSAHWVAPSHDIAMRLDKLEHIYRMRALLWSQRACGCTEQRGSRGVSWGVRTRRPETFVCMKLPKSWLLKLILLALPPSDSARAHNPDALPCLLPQKR